MSAPSTNKNAGCIWAFLGVVALVAVIGSCTPSSKDKPSEVVNDEAPLPHQPFDTPRTYVLSTPYKTANLRGGPSTQHPIIRQVAAGENITIIGRATDAGDGWLVVSLENGKLGYIKESLVSTKVAKVSKSEVPHFKTSFDCSNTSHQTEALICENEALAASDVTMAEIYNALLPALSDEERKRLVSEQHAWIAERNQCFEESDAANCLSQQYQLRIINLQLAQPSQSADESQTTEKP